MISYRLIVSIGVIFFLFACTQSKNASIRTGQPVLLDSVPGTAPYITKDHSGRVAVSWAKAVNDSVFQFCYAVSPDNGKSFDKIVTVPGSTNLQPHSENLPKIIFKPSGEVIALWGAGNANPKNKYSGLVFYSMSFDEGLTWNEPRALVTDTAGYDQRYYDVALLPNGEAAIIWLDNRKTNAKAGSALYFARTDGRNGFQNERKISEGCCQCCRTDLFIDAKAGIHILYRGIIQDSMRDMLHSVSTDGGNTFSVPQLISDDHWVLRGCPHTGPAMTENKEGLHFTWFTGGSRKGSFYTQSADNGKTFVNQDRISETGSHPQIIADSKDRLVLAWDENFQYKDNWTKRIGVQVRTNEGKELIKQYITADGTDASYPVISALPDQSSIIAYTIKKADKNYVSCQRVFIDE